MYCLATIGAVGIDQYIIKTLYQYLTDFRACGKPIPSKLIKMLDMKYFQIENFTHLEIFQ